METKTPKEWAEKVVKAKGSQYTPTSKRAAASLLEHISVQKQLVEALEAARSSLEATDGYLMYLKDKGAKSSLLETCLKTNEAAIQQTIAAILAAKASS